MKDIFCLEIQEGDGVNVWEKSVLHTTNEKQLIDLAKKLNKKHKNRDISFTVRLINVATKSLDRELLKVALHDF